MNRYFIITAVAIAVIVVPFAVSTINIIGGQYMEYRWDSPGIFSFFKMSTDGDLEFCNTLPFWVNLRSFEATMFYNDEELGTYSADSIFLDPLVASAYTGEFRSERLSTAYSIFMAMDFEISDATGRMDTRQFEVEVEVDTPILGLIPYSTTTSMSGLEFDQIMRADDLFCN